MNPEAQAFCEKLAGGKLYINPSGASAVYVGTIESVVISENVATLALTDTYQASGWGIPHPWDISQIGVVIPSDPIMDGKYMRFTDSNGARNITLQLTG